MSEDSREALHRDEGSEADAHVPTVTRVVADDEVVANVFDEDSFDLVSSVMSLGWANDLPGCFIQVSEEHTSTHPTVLQQEGGYSRHASLRLINRPSISSSPTVSFSALSSEVRP